MTFMRLLVVFLILAALPLKGQKPLISHQEDIIARATSELDSLFKTGGPMQIEAAKRGLAGEYVMDITVFDKGKVQSIFVVSSNAINTEMQNRVKDFVRTVEFGFKIPKSTNCKVRYTFQF